MVLGLSTSLDYDYTSTRIIRRLGDYLEKQRLGNVIGARTGKEEPAGFEDFEGSEIDLFVAALSGFRAVSILRERRRIEDDHLELPVRLVVLLQ